MPWNRFFWEHHLDDRVLWYVIFWLLVVVSGAIYWLLRRRAKLSVVRTAVYVSTLIWVPALYVLVAGPLNGVGVLTSILLAALFVVARAWLKADLWVALASCIAVAFLLGRVTHADPIGRLASTLVVFIWPAVDQQQMALLVILSQGLVWGYLVYRLLYRFSPPFRAWCSWARAWCGGLMEMEAGAGGGVDREERRRIGAMVAEGRITAAEACDLLDALGRNATGAGGKDTMGFADFLAIAATGLVALGFFLPWVNVNLGLPPEFSGWTGFADVTKAGGVASHGANGVAEAGGVALHATQSGYNLGALGWAVLCLGVLLTVPVFVTAAKVLLKVHVVQLVLTLVGMAVVLSLLWRAGDAACSGLFVCALGFIMGIAAAVINVRKVVR